MSSALPRDASATAKPWRVLIVDDSRDDAELAELALRDAGLQVECRRVFTAEALRAALPAFAPQVVLSDVNIPGFSGTEAQAEVRDYDPAMPFVFMTGSLYAPDETLPAADALLLKDELAKLPALLQQLLGEA